MQHAEVYIAKTVELDPLVHAAIQAVEDYPGGLRLLDELQGRFPRQWRPSNGMSGRRSGAVMWPYEYARSQQHVSRLWRKVADLHERANQLVDEANALVSVWSERLEALQEADERPA